MILNRWTNLLSGVFPPGRSKPQRQARKPKTIRLRVEQLEDRLAPATFLGGISVAAGDVNNDGFADIIAGARAGGGPQVLVFSGRDGSILHNFMAFGEGFRGGISVAAGD